MIVSARQRGKNTGRPVRAGQILTNSIFTGYSRTLRAPGSQDIMKPLGVQEGLVDAIADLDVRDTEAARKLSIKVLPSPAPLVLIQYRVPIGSTLEFDNASESHGQYGNVATNIRSGVVTVRPPGPLGVVVVKLRPEAAARFLGDGLGAFANTKIGLGDLLGRGGASVLEGRVAEARSSIERIAIVTDFLRVNMRERDPDPVVSWAAKRLRHNPLFRIRHLAAESGVSERHLSRRFRAVFGISPKEFARMGRLEKVLAARAAGWAWADLSYACGFSDQAHMINDTRAILGASPERVLAPSAFDQRDAPPALDSTTLFMW